MREVDEAAKCFDDADRDVVEHQQKVQEDNDAAAALYMTEFRRKWSEVNKEKSAGKDKKAKKKELHWLLANWSWGKSSI